MKFCIWLISLGSLFLLQVAQACPWCKNSPIQNPTVTAEMGDLGGKFFGKPPPPEKTRHYYIAAEPMNWEFMPKKLDPVSKAQIPARFFANSSTKLRYVQYTDETYTVRANHPRHL